MRDEALSQQSIEWAGAVVGTLGRAHNAADRTAAMGRALAGGGGGGGGGGGELSELFVGLESAFGGLPEAEGGTCWVGDVASPGDLAAAAACDLVQLLQPGWVDQFPRCQRLLEVVRRRPPPNYTRGRWGWGGEEAVCRGSPHRGTGESLRSSKH